MPMLSGGSLSKTKLAALEYLENRAFVSNAQIKNNWSASWLNVENLFLYYRNVMAYKIINRLCHESL